MGARLWLEMGREKKPLGMSELGCADGCGREWVEMGGEKKPLGMSELGCAYGCGRRGCKEWLEMGGKKKPLGMSERTAWLQGGGWKWVGRIRSRWGVGGNGWGEEAAGDERAWLRGRLRTANGSGRRSRWRSASLPARTAVDGVGAREWLEMGGEEKPLGMSELGCTDGWAGRRSRWGRASLAARTAADVAARTASDGKWVGRRSRRRSASLPHSMFPRRAEKNEICSERVHNVHLLKRCWQEAKGK